MGVDVEPGCGGGGGRCYAAVVLEAGSVKARYRSLPLYRLIRLVWEHNPDIVAVDNVYELAEDREELARVLSLFPPSVEVVQVTRLPDGSMIDLKRLARLAGVDPGPGKPSPGRTAYLAAVLASMGYGSSVRFVEERTRIVVARARRLKHGGMSSRRYQRRIRAAILRAVKDIKRVLDRNGLDYDLMFRKSGGGLDSAVFIVYAPRERLNGLVKKHVDSDVRIEIEPVYRSRVVFEEEPRGGGKPYLVVGVDPGVSTGIVALDLSGRPVLAVTRRDADRGEIVELIRSHGVPLVIATDVVPAPEFVKKLAGMLRAQLYVPPQPLPVEEKREILEEYLQRYPYLKRSVTPHVRDALAAAVKAYRYYEGKLRQVEAHISRLGLEVDIEKLKAAVIKGSSMAEALENAIREMLSPSEPGHPGKARPQPQRSPAQQAGAGNGSRAAVEVELLRAENHALKTRLRELEEQVSRLEGELRLLSIELRDSLERDREISMLKQRITVLQEELDRARAAVKALEEERARLLDALYAASLGELVPAPLAEEVDGDVVAYLEALSEKYGKLLLAVKTVNPVSLERHRGVLSRSLIALLAPRSQLERCTVLEEAGLPVLPLEDYLAGELEGTALLSSRVIADAYKRKLEIEEEKRRREEEARRAKTLTRDGLRRLLEEYRSKRARMLLKNSASGPAEAGGG